ncbi:hypothetical protein [Streptomyces flavochromogenes]|uniref:hypothetical protein n=1 Tax=Streptomyces flavochromogenes TaxID=68199 RepID=UPI0004BF7A25|nr:hypothetical protein [Streptomyces flavochromogenes]
MTTGRLASQLWRIGASTAHRAEAGRIRSWALALATALLTLAVGGLAVTDASFDGRTQRTLERSPRLTAAYPDEPMRALWRWDPAEADGLAYDVIHLEPLTDRLTPPPGLPRWPLPGEAFASRALLDASGADAVAAQYGRLAGVIEPAGLEAPGEFLVYTRPTAAMLDRSVMQGISGFGETTGTGVLGEHLHYFGKAEFLAAYAGFVLLPVALLVAIAVRTGATARDRRTMLLAALGSSRFARACCTAGEAARPVALGAAAGAVAMLPALIIDIPLPSTTFILAARDVRAAAPLVAGILVAVPAAILLVTALAQPRRRAQATRPTAVRTRRATWSLWLFPVALLFTVRVVDLAPPDTVVVLYATGYLLVLVTLPSAIGTCVSLLGPHLATLGYRRGAAGPLLAGRRMAAAPHTVTRLVAALVIAIGIAVQIQVWTASLTAAGQGAVDSRERLGTSVLRVAPYAEPAKVQAFHDALPPEVHALAVQVHAEGKGQVELVGDCPALRELRISCNERPQPISFATSESRLREYLGGVGAADGMEVVVRSGDIAQLAAAADAGRELVLFGTGGQQLPLATLNGVAHRHLAMTARVDYVLNGGGLGKLTIAAGWLRLLSTAGITIVCLSAGIGAITDFLRFGRELAPLSVIAPGRRLYGAVAGWSLLLPAALASLAGVGLAWWLAAPVRSVAPSDPLGLASLTSGALVCALALTVWGAATALRAATGWRPGGD